MKYLSILMSVFATFVFVACASVYSPKEVAKQYVRKMYDDKIQTTPEELVKFYSTESKRFYEVDMKFHNTNARKCLAKRKKETKSKGGIKKIALDMEGRPVSYKDGEWVESDNWYVCLIIIYNNGDELVKEVYLIKENREYLIVNEQL